MENENHLIQERKRKLNEIKEKDVNPFAHKYAKKHFAADLQKEYSKLKKEASTKKKAKVAGRLMSLRRMGKATFAHLMDTTGRIQLYFRQDTLGKEKYKFLKKLDIGDIIGAEGTIFRTRMGELTIEVKKYEILTKSLRPLPEKFHGLQDQEIRYRKRYLDLIMNPEVKEVFKKRTQIIHAMREFLVNDGYIEVETPILQPLYGGTNARPFESFLNALKMKVYMRISDELYLKRLIAGGYEKVFEFCPDFRNEGADKTHNPEFLQIETMCAYADYMDNMDFFEKMIEFIVKKVHKTTKVKYQGTILDFKKPWKRITMLAAIKKYTKKDLGKTDLKEIQKAAKQLGVAFNQDMVWGEILNLIFEEKVEEQLIQPTIIYDYPQVISPLAKQKESDPRFVERFEPYVNAWELGNVYSELNDPEILKENFKKQRDLAKKGDLEAQPTDDDFIECMEYGMPPTSGIGIGVDRLVMLLTDSVSIRDVILFPFMKPEQ